MDETATRTDQVPRPAPSRSRRVTQVLAGIVVGLGALAAIAGCVLPWRGIVDEGDLWGIGDRNLLLVVAAVATVVACVRLLLLSGDDPRRRSRAWRTALMGLLLVVATFIGILMVFTNPPVDEEGEEYAEMYPASGPAFTGAGGLLVAAGATGVALASRRP